ncbi:MAG: fumarylacetoacetase [Pseudomonadales bacterium]
MTTLNETHAPELRSWLAAANSDKTDFPIQNLPFSSFREKGSTQNFRCGIAIGDQIVDLAALAQKGLFDGLAQQALDACSLAQLNTIMAMGAPAWAALRLSISRVLREGAAEQGSVQQCLLPQKLAEFQLPCQVGDFTDFYSSVHHACAVGALFRPDKPLLPNYKWVPIAYHGRSSSINVSGHSFHRPKGQLKSPDTESPTLQPTQRLDHELELAIYIGTGNQQGSAIDIESAEQHVFGVGLLNDWSARDIQAWEYQPLGPFLAKNFASTVSPWIVTLEALAPFRTAFKRPATDPQPLPYLSSESNNARGGIDISVQAELQTSTMRSESLTPDVISTTSFKHNYWTMAQLVAHHTVNGCNLRTGDILGTGTQSGPVAEQAGSLLELSNGGANSIALSSGEQRTFIEDGDRVILSAWCEAEGAARIGFGLAESTVKPAL